MAERQVDSQVGVHADPADPNANSRFVRITMCLFATILVLLAATAMGIYAYCLVGFRVEPPGKSLCLLPKPYRR